MAFRPGQRGGYFESLRQQGLFNPKIRGPGLHPTQPGGIAPIANSPALPPTMPPANNMPKMVNTQMAPLANPMKPLNPAGGGKFGRVKKFF